MAVAELEDAAGPTFAVSSDGRPPLDLGAVEDIEDTCAPARCINAKAENIVRMNCIAQSSAELCRFRWL